VICLHFQVGNKNVQISIKERLNMQKKENRGGKGQKIVIARTGIRSQASKNRLMLGMSAANPLDYRG
jgi:hypothetical protein